MRSYRVGRRTFLSGLGGAVGLHILLRNLEAVAEGAQPPPRFLMAYWPVGTVRYAFLPETTSPGFNYSPILKPIETAGLRDDAIILYGLSKTSIPGQGGGHEKGTITTSTGVPPAGIRFTGGQADDTMASGPSFDQIFLKRSPRLARPGRGYANAICDNRVDSLELACRCLSYSYSKQSTLVVGGGVAEECVPLLPTLSPHQLYLELFGNFVPGGSRDELARLRRRRTSVLDLALRQLGRVRTLAPADTRDKIDLHTDAIRKLEIGLEDALPRAELCHTPLDPDPSLVGKEGSKIRYNNTTSSEPENEIHERIGGAHMAIIRAAFQCDLIRVATFQWAPGLSQVAFQGLYPGEAVNSYMHNPVSHKIPNSGALSSPTAASPATKPVVDFLINVHTWYNQKTASILAEMKRTTDVFGGNLLDHTIVPFVTDVADAAHAMAPMPAVVFGGRALGMRGGQYVDVRTNPRPFNDLWLTIAQAYFPDEDVMTALAGESFLGSQPNVGKPIAGLWAKP